jgi:hypothetical protein
MACSKHFTQSTRVVSKFSIAACCSAPLPIGPTPGVAQPPASGNTQVLQFSHIMPVQHTKELAQELAEVEADP